MERETAYQPNVRHFGGDKFNEVIPNALRGHLVAFAMQQEDDRLSIVTAFHDACAAIAPAIRLMFRWQIHFAANPFIIPGGDGTSLTYAVPGNVINSCFENYAFIDCNEIHDYPHPLKVASILEELVHVCLNVGSEDLAKPHCRHAISRCAGS